MTKQDDIPTKKDNRFEMGVVESLKHYASCQSNKILSN